MSKLLCMNFWNKKIDRIKITLPARIQVPRYKFTIGPPTGRKMEWLFSAMEISSLDLVRPFGFSKLASIFPLKKAWHLAIRSLPKINYYDSQTRLDHACWIAELARIYTGFGVSEVHSVNLLYLASLIKLLWIQT